jgi:enamine deaminase RidA (YjgF/YER057c/UK114 family)
MAATVTPVNPWSWSEGFGYEQANLVDGATRTLVCAGQTSVDGEGNPLHVDDMAAQLQLALDNLEAVLEAASMSLADVVRLNYYTTDLDAFFPAYGAVVERLRAAGCRPAGTLLEVSRLALPGLMVEMEATASR